MQTTRECVSEMDKKWWEKLNSLQEYKVIHGHCDINLKISNIQMRRKKMVKILQ